MTAGTRAETAAAVQALELYVGRCDWSEHAARAVLDAVTAKIERRAQIPLLSLIEDLTDPDTCWYDHHGYCQPHGLHPRPCPHERARRVLARATTGEEPR